jgi:dephospho-CoA kinase
MLIVGLTGSIGMGKSTAAAHLRERGLPVFDADAEVHRLYAGGKAVDPVERAFPGTTTGGGIDRAKLSAVLVANPARFRELEAIVHPLVREAERAFLREHAEHGAEIAVLEIPLLFETGADKLVDVTIVVSAAPEVQRARLMKRPEMSAEKLDRLLSRQVPDAKKRTGADFVVDTSFDVETSQTALDAAIAELRGRPGKAYARHWAKHAT